MDQKSLETECRDFWGIPPQKMLNGFDGRHILDFKLRKYSKIVLISTLNFENKKKEDFSPTDDGSWGVGDGPQAPFTHATVQGEF